MKKTYLLGLTATVLLSFGAINSQSTQAATIQTPIKGTSYIRKGNTYKLHLKVPGRVTINTKAKYTIINTSSWKCIPYKGNNKNTKVFYLRAGNYKLTTNSKTSKIKTRFTKLTSLKKTLDDFPIGKKEWKLRDPDSIKMNQKYKGFLDMFKTYEFAGDHTYKFSIDKPQKVTMNLSTMPVYERSKTNIFSNTYVNIEPVTTYGYDMKEWRVKGKVTNKQNSWYLAKGTYILRVTDLRGRFNFKLSSEDTDLIPEPTQIKDIKSTSEGIEVTYSKAKNATGYEVYETPTNLPKPEYYTQYSYNGINVVSNKYPDALTQTITKNRLINGESYNIAVRSVKTIGEKNNLFGEASNTVKFTYYVPLTGEKVAPAAPVLTVSYYDDHGSDEPYIDMKWNKNTEANSYEIAYRVKGQKDWHTYVTRNQNWENISGSNNKNDALYFEKGKTYELKIRGLKSNLRGPWSAMKTATVNITPAR